MQTVSFPHPVSVMEAKSACSALVFAEVHCLLCICVFNCEWLLLLCMMLMLFCHVVYHKVFLVVKVLFLFSSVFNRFVLSSCGKISVIITSRLLFWACRYSWLLCRWSWPFVCTCDWWYAVVMFYLCFIDIKKLKTHWLVQSWRPVTSQWRIQSLALRHGCMPDREMLILDQNNCKLSHLNSVQIVRATGRVLSSWT